MNLMVLAPAVLPTMEEVQRKMRLFFLSCARFGITPQLYGVGTTHFPGYAAMKVDLQLDYLERCTGYTHVLYTDSWDVLFTGPLEEIIVKYESLGSPEILVSAFYQLGNCSNEQERYPDCFDHSIYHRYPNVGGYIAEIPVICEKFRLMKKLSHYNDDSFMWYDGWQRGWFRPVLDSECLIFQVRGEENVSIVEGPEHPRIRNEITKSEPCIWHICGGYASHETGKEEVMLPLAERLRLI